MLPDEPIRARPAPDFATLQRAFRDVSHEIAAERAGPVLDLGFLRAMTTRRDELLDAMVRLHCASDGALC